MEWASLRRLTWFWLAYLALDRLVAFGDELKSVLTYPIETARPHSNLLKLRDTIATYENALVVCRPPYFEDEAFEANCLKPANEALSSVLEDILIERSPYTELVIAYQRTLERDNGLHTKRDKTRWAEIVKRSHPEGAIGTYVAYAQYLCETALPQTVNFEKRWVGRLRFETVRDEVSGVETHECKLVTAFGDKSLTMTLWIQTVKLREEPVEFYKSLSLIGSLEPTTKGKGRFTAFEVVSCDTSQNSDVVAGVLPPPDYSATSYLRKWQQMASPAQKTKAAKPKSAGERELQLTREADSEHRRKVARFYESLQKEDGILRNQAKSVYRFNVAAPREHYASPGFNSMAELETICKSMRQLSAHWEGRFEMCASEYVTALCQIDDGRNGYEKSFWIRIASESRSLYFVGEWHRAADSFDPYDMVYKHDSEDKRGLVGAVPPESAREPSESPVPPSTPPLPLLVNF